MRIGIVDDMPMAAEAVRRAVALRPQHQVAWTASNGAEAVTLCLRDTPDLILMDLVMPVMDGVEATRQIMAKCPCAILVVTASVSAHADKVFAAMGWGALDAVDTPTVDKPGHAPLLAKIDMLSRLIGESQKGIPAREPQESPGADLPLVVIGASAGGPSALAAVLGSLPKKFRAATVIIQHVDEQFAPSLASWLAQQSALPVVAACEGDAPVAGRVMLAVKDDHLIMQRSGRLAYTAHPRDAFYRPSVDVFFESVAKHWKGPVVGVLLTGMGRDGAVGLKRLRDSGYHTIAQNQATCAVYGMPKAAANLDAAVEILPLEKIAAALEQRISNRR